LKIAHCIESAAEAASVKESDIAAAIRSGLLRARRLNDQALILSTDLHAWVESLPEF